MELSVLNINFINNYFQENCPECGVLSPMSTPPPPPPPPPLLLHYQSPHKYQFNNQRHDILVEAPLQGLFGLISPTADKYIKYYSAVTQSYLSQRATELIRSQPACNYTESPGGCWRASGLCGSHFRSEGTAWL